MTDREFRLRLRIDTLTDERDQLAQKLETTRSQRDRIRERNYALTKQLALWKTRALRK